MAEFSNPRRSGDVAHVELTDEEIANNLVRLGTRREREQEALDSLDPRLPLSERSFVSDRVRTERQSELRERIRRLDGLIEQLERFKDPRRGGKSARRITLRDAEVLSPAFSEGKILDIVNRSRSRTLLEEN